MAISGPGRQSRRCLSRRSCQWICCCVSSLCRERLWVAWTSWPTSLPCMRPSESRPLEDESRLTALSAFVSKMVDDDGSGADPPFARDQIRDQDTTGRSGTSWDGCNVVAVASATNGDGGDASY